jgi:GntR family transcriptional regulator, transcriptional repressor for pyruvate dehydrogenase complex
MIWTSYQYTGFSGSLMYLPIQPERLYEQIVSQIEQRIVAGDLKTGDQLPSENELAKQFAVSRTAVREAIKALQEKRLVEVRPGRGTFITNGMPDAMRHSLGLLMKFGSVNGFSHLVEVREILEPEIAALAATRITDEHIASMREAVEIMDTALDDVDTFVEADLDFHLALAEATQNPIIPILVDSIIDLLRKQRKRIGLVSGGLRRGQFHHKKILEAVIRRDSQAARQAMQDHLEQVRVDTEASAVDTE